MNRQTIGIIGGGQLARMLSIAAARLGFHVIILDPNPDSPASQVSTQQLIANYDDKKSLNSFADLCDYATYETENIPLESIAHLSTLIPIYPSSQAIKISQDRLLEKQFFQDLGLSTVDFHPINSQESLNKTLSETNKKGILKTRRLGYDGKGQTIYSPNDSTDNIYASLGNTPLIFETFIQFEREVSIIAARDINGQISFYDPIENTHINGILRQSVVPANINKKIAFLARGATEKILKRLDYIGVLCVEFFVVNDTTIFVNEMAPRVHNSGHWTEAACTISQFEQHIRSVSHLPLGKPYQHSNCIMHNLIGPEIDQWKKWLNLDSSMLHLYGKSKTLPGRKMGHVTQIHQKKL
ncbi:MAG: 5-(carboxyamino)imidazole ribonucleotide synthase [Candidatus Liberibacter ctenarytainae]|uniref:N5-carboxyaminoimidazole ribonucleotide synthase n=1 Tax=Candidatus Liberibacter ctenarytainae TaxID=2020335 RepID=A0A937AD35_9HYPH|nr:5-(carboxyamino)imidazole ribonucleotide synthase [Candidatus Liberibacter ctenarytainae]